MALIVAVALLTAGATSLVAVHFATNRAQPLAATLAAAPTPSPSSTSSSPVHSSSSAPVSFAAIYAREQSGVVRIETLSCTQSAIGTGFLLSPTLVATVNHAVAQSVVISLIIGGTRATGTVIGSDPSHDLALVRVDRPLTGYVFRFAETDPDVGEQVAAMGFPIGDPLTLTEGAVSGLNRSITVKGQQRTGLIQTDAAINPGNSGGPLIAQDGSVVGLVDALNPAANGIAYAVPVSQATPAMQGWQAAPSPAAPTSCPNPLGPAQARPEVPPPTGGGVSTAQAVGIVIAFNTYFGGINSGNYAAAYAVLSPRLQANSSEAEFAAGDATSFDFGQRVLEAHSIGPAAVSVALAFTSIQRADKGPNGDVCDNWTILYTMLRSSDGSWRIDRAAPYHGVLHTTC